MVPALGSLPEGSMVDTVVALGRLLPKLLPLGVVQHLTDVGSLQGGKRLYKLTPADRG